MFWIVDTITNAIGHITNFVKNSLIQQVYETEAMYLDVYDIKYLLSPSETIPSSNNPQSR